MLTTRNVMEGTPTVTIFVVVLGFLFTPGPAPTLGHPVFRPTRTNRLQPMASSVPHMLMFLMVLDGQCWYVCSGSSPL